MVNQVWNHMVALGLGMMMMIEVIMGMILTIKRNTRRMEVMEEEEKEDNDRTIGGWRITTKRITKYRRCGPPYYSLHRIVAAVVVSLVRLAMMTCTTINPSRSGSITHCTIYIYITRTSNIYIILL